MKRLNDGLFLVGNNCFNRQTLEIFSLDEAHLQVLERITAGEPIMPADYLIGEELKEGGLLTQTATQINEPVFSPEFVGFRLVLGEICNLHCKGCFVKNRQHNAEVMTTELLDRIIAKTFQFGTRHRLKYHFFGGEPLLMMSQLKRAVELIESAYGCGTIQQPIFTVTTNGTLIDQEIAAYFSAHNFKVGISLDGPEELNDFIRGQGVFKSACRGFQILEKAGVEKWFLVTPYDNLLDRLPDFIEFLTSNFQFSSITFNTPFDGKTIGWIVDGGKLADAILECYRHLRGKKITIESAAGPVFHALSSGIRRHYPCSISDREVMASISPDGRVSFCAQYWGNDLFHEQFVQDYRLSWQQAKPLSCTHCVAEHICGGPCYINYRLTGNIDLEKCRFYKRLLEKFLTDPSGYLDAEQLDETTLFQAAISDRSIPGKEVAGK